MTLAEARSRLPAIRTKLRAKLAARGITVADIAVDAQTGITVTIERNGVQSPVVIGRGWRGMGHLTSYPIEYLRGQIQAALADDGSAGE